MTTPKMPNLTPAQFAATAAWIVAQLIAYNVLDVRYQQLAVSIGATFLAAAWKIADAIIRHGRSRALIPPPTSPTGPSA